MPPRSAEIHLHVGRLIDFIVSVTQDVERKLELYIEDLEGNPLEELVFYDFYGNDKPYEPKAFRVRWSPYGTNYQGVSFTCQVRTTVVGDEHFDYKPGTEQITPGLLTDATGMKEYIIEPTPFTDDQVSERLGNPFLQHASWVTFTVTDPDDSNKTISKTIYLNHQHIAITSRNFRRLSYLGRAYTFNVQANTPWVIDSIAPQEEEFQISNYTPVGTTGGNNILEGHRLTYTTPTENPGNGLKGIRQAGRKATFYLRDQRGIIPDLVPFTITAVCEDPNSFIVHPSSSGSTLRIPIRKLFWIREREAGDASVVDLLHNSNTYEPHIVWQEYYDQTGAERQDYQVSLISIPDGSNALEDFLEVTFPPAPSNGVMGNALVGIKRKGTNNLLWSWHIWLTDYNPEPAFGGSLEVGEAWFMHRNLGALSDEHQLNAHTIGFYYQWGRKDPLRPKDIPTHRRGPALENLIHSINAPDVFFTEGGKGDWYTSSGLRPYQNDFLWTEYDDHKSQYDPCPEGWRVPNFKHEDGMAISLWRLLLRYDYLMENTDFLGALLTRKSDSQGTLFMPGGGYYDPYGTLKDYKKEAMNFNANASQYDDVPHEGLYAGQGIYGGGDEIPMPRASAMPVRCVKRKK
ncbi:MAG: fibrobacter succinogenes major paralogous domain-containing protein [Bacteroides sp.]|nr:fibrobacter succinogenes major paralogous domain-containing protein [Bacteroides sp.]